MANPSKLGAICYEAESSWAEDITTFATLRLPIVTAVDASGLKQDKLNPDRTPMYRQQLSQLVLGVMGGSFKTKLYLCGHGSSTAGATSATLVMTLLSKVLGNITISAANGTTATGGTATAPLTTSSGTFTAGSLTPIGVLGDGRGNGQFARIATHSSNTLNLSTAIDGAPNNGDIVGSAECVYPSETPTSTAITGLRFLLQTANLQYECHGCVATDIAFGGLKTAEMPYVEITWAVSWWRYSTATFPSTATTEVFQPSANAAGSLFVNDVGTATRVKRTNHDLTIDYKLGVELLMGPGGVNAYQAVIGARRTVDEIKVSWIEAADANTTTPVLPGFGTATVAKHLLATMNPTAGTRVGFYFPQLYVSNVAIQYADQNLQRLKLEAMAGTGPTTTSDLTAAAMVVAAA